MESEPTSLIYFDIVFKVEEITPVLRTVRSEDEIIETYGEKEWHVVLRDSLLRLKMGQTKPAFLVGDHVRINIEKVLPK